MPHSLQPCRLYSPWNSPGQNTGVGLSLLQGIFPTQGLNPGLPHCGRILYHLSHQGGPRILEWEAYPFSRGYSQCRNQTGSPALQVDSLPAKLSGKPNNNIPNPGIRPRSPTLQADPLPAEPQGKPNLHEVMINYKMSNTKKSTPLQLAGKQSKIGPNEGEREP